MIDLYNEPTGELLGTITETELRLIDALEEESFKIKITSSTRRLLT
jgi:hypothetical protein